MRQLRETRQHWRDRKRIAESGYADVRAEHRRVVALLQAEQIIAGEKSLSGSWSHYSCVEIGQGWVLIYRLDEQSVLLVRVAPESEIFV